MIKFSPSVSGTPFLVPIVPITMSVHNGNSIHERQQLSLKLAWALTIHKSQGLTLHKSWIDIGKSEATLGLTYVAISRVRDLSSLILEPMTFDRLGNIKKSNLKYRKAEELRLQTVAEKTKKFFFKQYVFNCY